MTRGGDKRRELLECLHSPLEGINTLATPNYGYEKRQKELAKKRKKEEKLKLKAERKQSGGALDEGTPPADSDVSAEQDAPPTEPGA